MKHKNITITFDDTCEVKDILRCITERKQDLEQTDTNIHQSELVRLQVIEQHLQQCVNNVSEYQKYREMFSPGGNIIYEK